MAEKTPVNPADLMPAAPKFSLARLSLDIGAWVQAHAGEIAIAGAVGVVIYLILTMLVGLVTRLDKAGPDQPSLAAVLGRAARKTNHIFLMATAAKLVSGYANSPREVALTIDFLFTVTAVFQAAVWLREVILGLIERRTGEDGAGETLANAMGIIRLLISAALFAVAMIVVLDNLGVNVTGLVAGLGIGGIAIGLAAQGIFADLFAALSIIFDKPFRQGETINYDATVATVERIGLKSTRLRAVTGEKKVISNANLLQKEITSYQGLDHRRLKFAIGVIYQTDPEAAAGIPAMLKDIVERNGATFVRSGFVGFGASSLNFEVEFDVHLPDWDEIYALRHAIGLDVLRRFNAEGLGFAYPAQTTFTAAPDGKLIMPYPNVMPVMDANDAQGPR